MLGVDPAERSILEYGSLSAAGEVEATQRQTGHRDVRRVLVRAVAPR